MHIEKSKLECFLVDFCEALLRNNDKISLGEQFTKYAEIIEVKLSKADLQLYHIQWADKTDPTIKYPILWRWNDWQMFIGKWEKDKTNSEYERQVRFVEQENIRRTCKKVMDYFNVDENYGMIISYSLVTKGRFNALKELKVKLVKGINEI